MDTFDDNVLDNQLRSALPEALPSAVEHRLQTQLTGFRARLSAAEPGTRSPARSKKARRAWRIFGVTCTAAAVLAAVVGLSLRPQTSFAQVAAAVLEKPWVHTRTTEPDGQISEMWYSPGKEISATRRPGSVRYEDFRLQVFHSYQPDENVVYRGPIVWNSSGGEFEAMAETMKVILQTERAPDQPLANLGFLGSERSKMRVLDQGVTKVNEDGHAWLDYRITVSYEASVKPLQFLFRVDSRTKLPALCRAEGDFQGKPVVRESRFDFPERGPADIYDLGVPRTTKLVDRVPTGDLDRILKTLRAGRERMDSYRAVYVQRVDGVDHAWWTGTPPIFYRKGNLFRADYVCETIGEPRAVIRPAEGENLHKWWLERIKSFRYYTQYVLRDSVMYTSDTKSVTDADGSKHFDIESVVETRYNTKPGETSFPAEYSMRPEFVCRPPMGIGDEHQEPSLEIHPAEGPAGCFLLSVGHTSKTGRVNEKGVGMADGIRFWLDPKRDYIVVRWDMIMRDQNGKEIIVDNYTIEETARSPQGVWYATRVRRKNASGARGGKQTDLVYDIYVDFDVNFPDEFYKPQVAGRIY